MSADTTKKATLCPLRCQWVKMPSLWQFCIFWRGSYCIGWLSIIVQRSVSWRKDVGELDSLEKGNSFDQVGEFLPYKQTLTWCKFRAGSTVECGGENWICQNTLIPFCVQFSFLLSFSTPTSPSPFPPSFLPFFLPSLLPCFLPFCWLLFVL